jgi:hypothetical protein
MLARSGRQLGVVIDVVLGYILHIIMSVGHNVGLRFPYQVSHPRMRILNEKAMEYLDYLCSPNGPRSILRKTNIQNLVLVLKSPHLSRGNKCVQLDTPIIHILYHMSIFLEYKTGSLSFSWNRNTEMESTPDVPLYCPPPRAKDGESRW